MSKLIKFLKFLPYLIIIVLGIILYMKWNQPVEEEVKSNPMNTVAEVAKKFKDAAGANHIAIDKNANSVKPSDMSDPNKVPGFVDTASRALKIAKQEIDQITKLLFISEGKRLLAEKVIDSLGVESYVHNGKYLTLSYKNGYFDYRYRAGLDIVDYTKKTKFLGITFAKKSFTDFSLTDTAASFTGNVQRLTVDRREPQPWLKFNASYQYNLQDNAHGYGPGLRIDKGPLGLQVSQLYWPASQAWQTTVNAHLTLKNIF